MDKESIQRRLDSISAEIIDLNHQLYKLHEEDETYEGHRIRCAIEELSDEGCDLADKLDDLEDQVDEV